VRRHRQSRPGTLRSGRTAPLGCLDLVGQRLLHGLIDGGPELRQGVRFLFLHVVLDVRSQLAENRIDGCGGTVHGLELGNEVFHPFGFVDAVALLAARTHQLRRQQRAQARTRSRARNRSVSPPRRGYHPSSNRMTTLLARCGGRVARLERIPSGSRMVAAHNQWARLNRRYRAKHTSTVRARTIG
jgi:hypothetical protein